MTIKVLICDDHPVFRDGLDAMLSSSTGFEVVGHAATGEEAVGSFRRLAPSVVIMDLNMPGIDGIEATRRIVAADQDAKVLVLTMLEDDDSVFAAMRAGALGYLLKGADKEEIKRSIQGVARGEAIFGAGIARKVMGFLDHHKNPSRPFPSLTEREAEILELAAQGTNNAGIARRLGISDKTVRNHVSNIFMKVQVADRAELVAKARDAGIGEST